MLRLFMFAVGLMLTVVVAAAEKPLPAELRSAFEVPESFRNDLGDYRSPLRDAAGKAITSAESWKLRREQIRAEWLKRLGGWPELLKQPQVKYLESEQRGNVTQQHVHVEVAPGKFADGYVLLPAGPGPFPAVFVPFYEAKSSAGLGKSDTVGSIDFGWRLAQRGFVTLQIGTPGSIELPGADTRVLLVNIAKEFNAQPLGMLAYMSANCHTVLSQLKQVDASRIGMIGHSYGGKWTMFSTCLYDKFAAAVWVDPGVVFDESNRSINYWEPWYIGYDPNVSRQPGVPSETNPRTGLYKQLYAGGGHEMLELHALIAPRPVLISGGSEDPPHRWKALNHLIAVNKLLGYEQRVAMTNRPMHRPTPEAVDTIERFFDQFLKP